MSDTNIVVVGGRLTKDPNLRYTPQGIAICSFPIACNREWGTGEGRKKEASFFDVEVWRKTAEVCAEHLRKGREVLVQGSLKQDKWNDKETGKPRSKVLISAERVQFIGGKKDSGPPESEHI